VGINNYFAFLWHFNNACYYIIEHNILQPLPSIELSLHSTFCVYSPFYDIENLSVHLLPIELCILEFLHNIIRVCLQDAGSVIYELLETASLNHVAGTSPCVHN